MKKHLTYFCVAFLLGLFACGQQPRDERGQVDSTQAGDGAMGSDDLRVDSTEVGTAEPPIDSIDSTQREDASFIEQKKSVRSAMLRKRAFANANGLPRRISYNLTQSKYTVGDVLEIEINLTDSVGQKVEALKNYVITAQCNYLESKGSTETVELKIEKGTSGATLRLALKQGGPLSIILENEELWGTEVFLKVLGKEGAYRVAPKSGGVFHFASLLPPGTPVIKVNPPYSSDGHFRADGMDEAKLYLYLDVPADYVAPVVNVMIVASGGVLSQSSIQLENSVSVSPVVTLRSTKPGTIRVTFQSMNPNVPMDTGSQSVAIRFVKPVDAFYPDTVTAETHLLSSAQITIVPKDKDGNPTVVDQDVSVFARPTRADIVKIVPESEVVITPKKLGATFNLVPISVGTDKVILSVRNYPDKIITVTIMFPYIYLILSTAFGLLGGFLKVMMTGRDSRNYWHVAVGAISGNIAILGALFFKLGSLSENMILNQFVFCLLAFAGGWIGPKAVDWLVGRFFPPTNDNNANAAAPANPAGNP